MGRGEEACLAEVAMAAAMGAASAVVVMALGVEASEVFPSFSHRLLRRSTRRPRRPSTCLPHSRPGAEVEAQEDFSRGPATGATDFNFLEIGTTRWCFKNRWIFDSF